MSDVQPPTPPPATPPSSGPPAEVPSGSGGGARQSFGERLLGALRLDAKTYHEVEHDEEALPQALGVVALAAVAGGIGGLDQGSGGLVAGVFGAAIGWLVSAGVIWLVGVRILEHSSDYPELLRTLGFAQAPQLLMVLGVIGPLGAIVGAVVFFWGLAAYVVAVREALDVETGRAVLVCILGWGVSVVLMLVLAMTCAGALMGAGTAGG